MNKRLGKGELHLALTVSGMRGYMASSTSPALSGERLGSIVPGNEFTEKTGGNRSQGVARFLSSLCVIIAQMNRH